MNDYNKCINGHFYKDSYCPYCEPTDIYKLKNNTTLTPISYNASELYEQVNIILQLDKAPDNVNRYIRINRQFRDMNIKQLVANCIGCNEANLSNDIIEKTNELENKVNAELLKKNIIHIDRKDLLLEGDYFISEDHIGSVIPETLLTQILGRHSKLDLLYNEPLYETQDRALITGVSASFGDEEFQIARENVEIKKHLAISLKDNSVMVLAMKDSDSFSSPKTAEHFLSEDISIFNPILLIKRYHIKIVQENYNPNTFNQYLTKVANDSSLSIYFKISRQQIASVLTTLFFHISNLHKNGLIHCDLKPQNIFCFKDGLKPFDPVNVKDGEIAAGMTTNFCAPEQILTLPVSPSTDIYNLGLIILSIIDGVLYGKTSNYTIPTGGIEVKNVKLLTEPLIYIDYNSSNIESKNGIPFWKAFLEKCLAFDQKNRFPDMESFINEYIKLIELYPLKNEIEFKPNFGSLSLTEINSEFQAAWFV